MDAERAQKLGRYGGLFMLLVQLGVLYEFFAGFEKDLEHLPAIGLGLLLRRMSWLRSGPWALPALGVIVALLALLLGVIVAGFWVAGISRWRREHPRDAHE